jgi:hypothetical protein
VERIKISLDGAFHIGTRRGGCGSIGRDHDSNIIFVGVGAIAYVGKALAIEYHDRLPSSETNVNINNHATAPLLFRKIKSRLRLCFIESSIIYENRECN